MQSLDNIFNQKSILITGGLGSIGSEIAKQLLQYNIEKLIIVDNRETEIFYERLKYEQTDNVTLVFGDIRDKERMLQITQNIDIIFHTAAMKHVLICEYNPFEAIKTNVIGTQNLLECSVVNNVERFLLISTDKAVNPTNMMGSSKLAAERLVASMSNLKLNKKTKFGVVRFGNVLASRGSVLEIWSQKLEDGEKIPVTDTEMTRYFMSIPESVKLIFQALIHAKLGEILILKMPSVKIIDLASTYLELKNYSNDHFQIIGKRPGEKMHEELITNSEDDLLLENDFLFLRLPILVKTDELENLIKKHTTNGFNFVKNDSFSSADSNNLLTSDQIKSILSDIIT